MSRSNYVVAYGMDETGNYAPLRTTSTAGGGDIENLPKYYSRSLFTSLGAGPSVPVTLDAPFVGERIYIHSFAFTFSADNDGLGPIVGGLSEGGYLEDFGIQVGTDHYYVLEFGYLGEMINRLSPVSFTAAPPPNDGFALSGGVMKVDQIIDSWVNESSVLVNRMFSCSLGVVMCYSVLS